MRDKRIVAADLPPSNATDTKNKRYRITDSYLRFWPAFLERGIPLVERGRGDLALAVLDVMARPSGRTPRPRIPAPPAAQPGLA
ncbi:hypothetical protein [Nocardia canadensis]|uniref:hypothetical protein n=1 Tax=Nocardia canadensis TaxID=3065238 RepID=UPI00292E63A8|nr:hypothetical protein [Nocardia canadensis]